MYQFRRGAALALLVAVILGMNALDALGQEARLGATVTVSDVGATKRFSGVAYDRANDAYLVTWGVINLGARFVSADGTPLGAPTPVNINGAGTQAGAVGVACGDWINTCLVAWVEERPASAVVGRLVRYSGGGVAMVTNPFIISQNGVAKHTEADPGVAYSAASNEFIVTWAEYSSAGGPDVKAQRVSPAGAPLGATLIIAATGLWEGHPSVTYNSAQNEFLIAYYYETAGGTNAVGAQRVAAGSGNLIGAASTVVFSGFDQYPEVTYNSATNQYLVTTWGIAGSWVLHGRLVDGNGQPVGGALALAAGGGGDGIGVGYSASSGRYFSSHLSIHNDESWGVGHETGDAAPRGWQCGRPAFLCRSLRQLQQRHGSADRPVGNGGHANADADTNPDADPDTHADADAERLHDAPAGGRLGVPGIDRQLAASRQLRRRRLGSVPVDATGSDVGL
jgi:hypothetical protein